MDELVDGGPAFPCAKGSSSCLSWRDYVAVHSTQPGCAEICKCAGIEFDGYRVFLAKDDAGTKFDDWWRSLSLERMCQLSAQVRYAQADAMLCARGA